MRAASTAGAITLARLTANAKLVNGTGQVRAAFAGRRGAAFAFSTLADVSPDTIRLTGSGRIEREPLVLNQAAVLTRSGDGWALAPTSLSFAGGTAIVSGRSGSRPRSTRSSRRMPLEVLDLALAQARPVGGSATGRLDYAWKGNRNGRLDLKVRGLSRAGLVLASKPIDVGVAAIVNGNQAALARGRRQRRAIVGRAQARFAPMGGGPLMAELLNAPLFAQLRYAGPADTLWRLDRQRSASTCRARSRSARTSAAGLPIRSSTARSRRRTAGWKARSPAWSSTNVASQAASRVRS